MNPVYWLLIWLAGTALACLTVAFIFFRLGWDHAEQEADRLRRHTHREGDPAPGVLIELPRAGRIPLERLADPTPLPGESWDIWPVAGPAEYELLTQTAEQPVAGVDTPSDFIEGMTETVNAMISEWVAQGNVDRHTIRAGE